MTPQILAYAKLLQITEKYLSAQLSPGSENPAKTDLLFAIQNAMAADLQAEPNVTAMDYHLESLQDLPPDAYSLSDKEDMFEPLYELHLFVCSELARLVLAQ